MAAQTTYVFRAIQRDLNFDQIVPNFAIDDPVPVEEDVSNSGTETTEEELDANTDTDNEHDSESDSGSNGGDDAASAANANQAAPVPIHHRILPQDPDSTLDVLDHILNHWQLNTNSPWISVTDSLTFGVYYKTMADFMATIVDGYNGRDLYALEVPLDALVVYAPQGPLDDDQAKARNFTRAFQERLAHGELVVFRHAEVQIPEVILHRSQEWFQAKFEAAGGLVKFPYRQWQYHMRELIPDWLQMITNPIQAWQDEALAALADVDINA